MLSVIINKSLIELFLSSRDPYRTLTWYQFILHCFSTVLGYSFQSKYCSPSVREDISPFGCLHSRRSKKARQRNKTASEREKNHSSPFQLLTEGAPLRLPTCLPFEGWNPGQHKFFFLELISNVSQLHLTSFHGLPLFHPLWEEVGPLDFRSTVACWRAAKKTWTTCPKLSYCPCFIQSQYLLEH